MKSYECELALKTRLKRSGKWSNYNRVTRNEKELPCQVLQDMPQRCRI